MKQKSLLKVSILSLPPEGIKISGEVGATELDLPEDDQIQCPNPVQVNLHVSPVSDGILCKGSAQTVLQCRCNRCLENFDHKLSVNDICHFTENVQNDIIDLTEAVREDILLAFPQHSVCRETCNGLCPQCGQNLNMGSCDCAGSDNQEDPWGMLDNLNLNSEQTDT